MPSNRAATSSAATRALRALLALALPGALLAACTSTTLANLPADDQAMWSRCQPALVRSCEHEVSLHHYNSVNECLRIDENEYTGRDSASERRSYLEHHGCTGAALTGAPASGGEASAAPSAAPSASR